MTLTGTPLPLAKAEVGTVELPPLVLIEMIAADEATGTTTSVEISTTGVADTAGTEAPAAEVSAVRAKEEKVATAVFVFVMTLVGAEKVEFEYGLV